MKILYIEDEVKMAKPLIKVLESKGYIVDYYEDGGDGLKSAIINHYNCILLDLNLPGLNGLEIANRVRKEGIQTPIIMLTARGDLPSKIQGFGMGADDYMQKPFEIQELLARLELRIRKAFKNSDKVIKIDNFAFTPELNKLEKEGHKPIELSNKESGVLEYLYRNEGRVVSTTELLSSIWDTNIDLFTDTVKTHIKTLRKKIGHLSKHIKTIKGKGYTYEK